jgi:hypothetical protein
MIELLLHCGFDTLEYSWVKGTIGICTLADYSVAKKHQHGCNSSSSAGTKDPEPPIPVADPEGNLTPDNLLVCRVGDMESEADHTTVPGT